MMNKTDVQYQVLGNTLRIRQTKDTIMDLGVYDSITSPNNSVIHGGVYVNFKSGNASTSVEKPTSPTNNMFIFMPSNIVANSEFSVNVSNSSTTRIANDTYQSIEIGGQTFYGTKVGTFFSIFNDSIPGSTTTYIDIKSADLRVKVIKYVSASGEIVTEEYSKSIANNFKINGSATLYCSMTIPKTEDDILLFVGIENIFDDINV